MSSRHPTRRPPGRRTNAGSRRPAPRRGAAVAVLLLVSALLAACTSSPAADSGPGPGAQVAQFISDWEQGHFADAGALTDNPGTAAHTLQTVTGNLAAKSLSITPGAVDRTGANSATVPVSLTWTLPDIGPWKYQARWSFSRSDSGSPWQLTWTPTVIHPQLAPSQTLAVHTTPTTSGTLVDRTNTPLVAPVRVYSIVVLPGKVTDLAATADALAKLLSPFDKTVTAASITAAVRKADPKTGYTVINLREADYTPIAGKLSALAGVTAPSELRNLPPTKDFAKVLLSQVEPVAQPMEQGKAGWRIVSVDSTGAEVATLAEQDAEPGRNVVLTLDTGIQTAAEKAIANIPEPAVIVAIQPSTGGILAVAQNAPANALGPISLMGEYPPGSTFKIVTATAAFDANLVTPTTAVDCPGVWVLDNREIHNEGFDLGEVDVTTAFAHSCNTSFAKIATMMPNDALHNAALQYGIGRDFVIPGITTLTGKITPADSILQRAEDGFGQGTDLVTPFSAALMAATAATGNMPMPTLIKGTTTTIDAPAPPRSAAVRSGIRTLMRAVVTDGTARSLQDAGTVYAKTGTAEFVDPQGQIQAHAWTVGFRGDVAFAALIVGGNSSTRTNDLLDGFLHAIPGG